jgi:hypothetical protein
MEIFDSFVQSHVLLSVHTYMHTYHLLFILEGASQIYLRDTFYQNYLGMGNPADVTGGMLIAVLSQSILCVSAINPLGAFYHGRERCHSFILSRTSHEPECIFDIKS